MNNISQKQKIIEALGEGTMGTTSGMLGGLYFTENVIIILLLGAAGAVFGKVLFPVLVQKISGFFVAKYKTLPKLRLKKVIALFVIFLLVLGYSYLTIDTYSKGQKLYTTTRVKLKEKPGVGGKTISVFKTNTEVIYLNKGWKRIRWHEGGKRFFKFWRKVIDQNGRVGWIYGGYLDEQK